MIDELDPRVREKLDSAIHGFAKSFDVPEMAVVMFAKCVATLLGEYLMEPVTQEELNQAVREALKEPQQ